MLTQFTLVVLVASRTVAQSATDVGTNLLGSAVGAFLGTLIVGGIMILVFPDYTERTVRTLRRDPGPSLLYGLLTLVALIVLTVLLVLTIVGILVVIPLAFLAYILWAVGAAIAFITIGDRLVGHEGGWTAALVVGSAINGVLVLTGIGGFVSFLIGAAGFGAVIHGYLG
ncbi:hypothetical protein L593_05560 [Salinarchaeum sp. Harcht-Bsk1]|uniref:hypothetical protein n=1 Tax=Salinarchaeum sp. Harcht-Bsk1 TaxID=1333523 RepID=UPI000342497A|nr:hypothetical protein [Salinarchaeum sp. Harcht-Bsk1]AGN01061.1 hypothetical protein L593_05560 [Salinarchaeum sp. Harcht-Bsk1]